MAAAKDWQTESATAKARREQALARVHVFPAELTQKPAKDVTTIPHSSGAFSAEELDIISAEATDVLLKIRQRTWTAVAVAQAFIKSASLAQQLTNCLTETLFPEALARAKQLDDIYASTGRPVGLLHGLPMSLKDCFVTPPHSTSLGFAAWANEPTSADDESVLVKLLREHGAVVYCKTNTPTAMMMMESNNRVWGATLNPANLGCSAGGSSGGEGALLAMQGSPLGIGTDIGGSIRIPSAFTGLYSLKPSFGRLPTYATRSGIPGNDFIFSVNGPMARSLASLRWYCAALLADGPLAPWRHDPKCVPLPWKAPSSPPHAPRRSLRLGFLPPHDTIVTAHPPVARALALTKQACVAAGHEVLDWSPAGQDALFKGVVAAFLDLGGPAIGPLIEQAGEEWFAGMAGYKATWEASRAGGEQLSAATLRERNAARNALQKLFLDRWMRGDASGNDTTAAAPIDALVAPVSPWPACRQNVTNTPREHGGTPPYFGFTAVWSLLDVPAATLPVTKASRTLDPRAQDFQPLSDIDAAIQADYDPDFYDGTPVGLQVVGERLGEEKVLDVVAAVRQALESLPAEQSAQVFGVPVGADGGWGNAAALVGS